MADKKPCVRCEREIDGYARICPYCNWDQSQPAPPPSTQPQSAPLYVPPDERNWKRHIMIGVIGILLLIASFGVGALIQGRSKNVVNDRELDEEKAAPQVAVKAAPRADVTLVPVTDMGADTPITSAPVTNPAQGVPTEYQRSDATAVSSVEYAQLAKRAQLERAALEKKRQQALVDPRSITGAAYEQGQRPAEPAPMPQPQISSTTEEQPAETPQHPQAQPQLSREPARVIVSTRPVPEYQPIPSLNVRETTTARLELMVGADGRVKDVTIRNGVPGETAKIISTVQTWRFKPATENGVPVAAPFTVDISFRGND